jgi:hypothetical protein
LAQSHQPESRSPLSRYLRFDTSPSRFLLVSHVVVMHSALNACPRLAMSPSLLRTRESKALLHRMAPPKAYGLAICRV